MLSINPCCQIGYQNPGFGKSPKKMLAELLSAKQLDKFKCTYDEAVRMYNCLGYNVEMKRGSHSIAHVGNYNIPLVLPHKDKIVTPLDLKRLKFVAEGSPETAARL